MTELERWMNDHRRWPNALTAEETAALRAKVLARRQGCMFCAAGGWQQQRQRSA